MTYLNQLKDSADEKTILKRKKEYIAHNFGLFLNKLLKSKDCRVLEIGPGLGEFVSYCHDFGIKNIDINDNSKSVIKFIEDRFHIRNSFRSSNIITVANKLDTYDVIMMTQVLEHISVTNHVSTIKTLYKHLKKDAVLIITVPNIGNPLGIFERYYDYTHKTAFTEKSLLQLIDYCGLKEAKIYLQPFSIPPTNAVNLVRIIFQWLLHMLFRIAYLINGGVYPQLLTSNITLIVRKLNDKQN